MAEFKEVWRIEREQGIEADLLSRIAHILHLAHCAEPHPSPHKILTGEDKPEDPRITEAKLRIAAKQSQHFPAALNR